MKLESPQAIGQPLPFARDNFFIEGFNIEHEMGVDNPSKTVVGYFGLNASDSTIDPGQASAPSKSREEFPETSPG